MERKGDHQKLKMLYLVKIFTEETDDNHALTMAQIIEKLNSCGVNADRKTLYQDFEELRTYGLDINVRQEGRSHQYYLGARDFELPELKLLVDAVQSAKFITDKKSSELIKKLESLVSHYDARQLHRQVMITGRVKSMNESIYYNVDKIHEAINGQKKIRFKYFQWNTKKEMELRRDGEWYYTSPWALMWDDENYYLITYDNYYDKIVHYRVDKMLEIEILEEKREGQEQFEAFNIPKYSKSLFGMFSGEEVNVTLECCNFLTGVIIDRFGKEVSLIPVDEKHFRVRVLVALSDQFLGWVLALGDAIRIIAPETVVFQMKEHLQKVSLMYRDQTK